MNVCVGEVFGEKNSVLIYEEETRQTHTCKQAVTTGKF